MAPALPRILVVDDEAENLRALERTVRGKFDIVSTTSPNEALKQLQANEFAIIVSDQKMPEMAGTEFLEKAAALQPMATRILLTAFTETKDMLEAINRAQIYRYVTKPWDNAGFVTVLQQAAERAKLLTENSRLLKELMHLNETLESQVADRTRDLEKANERLNELAMIDPLTKVWNRRAFSSRIVEELQRSERYEHDVSLAMVDLDRFKEFNDMEGHLFGDEALKKVVNLFQSNLRRTDFLARYGGEEFVILMPETKLVHAKDICERLRQAIEGGVFQGKEKPAYLTVSIGVCAFPKDGKTKDTLIHAADQCLYQAKEAGRNRVASKIVEKQESFFVR